MKLAIIVIAVLLIFGIAGFLLYYKNTPVIQVNPNNTPVNVVENINPPEIATTSWHGAILTYPKGWQIKPYYFVSIMRAIYAPESKGILIGFTLENIKNPTLKNTITADSRWGSCDEQKLNVPDISRCVDFNNLNLQDFSFDNPSNTLTVYTLATDTATLAAFDAVSIRN